MKHLLSFLLVMAAVSMGSLANAQRVIKVKGQQAIVQFPQGTTPVVGETLSAGGGGAGDVGVGAIRTGSRDHSVGLSTDLGVFTVSPGGSSTQFDFTGRYGWNTQIFEFGPIATVNYLSDVASVVTRTLSGGGFFDFNFVPNVVGQPFIYGVGVEGTFGQTTRTVAGTDTSSSSMGLLVAGNAKWYGLSDHFCLRGDAGLSVARSSAGGSNTTTTGLLIRGGIAAYF